MAGIEFRELTKAFPGGTVAVDRLDLKIADGEFMVLVGPSGSGKTTVLRMAAGLEDATEGEVWIGDALVNDVPPMDRNIAMVFQSYALYPHMTASENMGFALKLQRQKKPVIRERVQEAARTLGIADLLKRKPGQLSGGQRQRVAMGRAIVREPAAFLMDEPLSNLDAKLRVQMRAEIQKLQHRLGTTTVYVTHDQTEAMTMADRVAVMRQGKLEQLDTPQRLYDRPRNLFVAGFIGSPAMNLLRARLSGSNGSLRAEIGDLTVAVPSRVVPKALERAGARDVILGIRPEHLSDAALATAPGDAPALEAPVTLAEPLGAEVMAHFELAAPRVVTRDTVELAEDIGAPGTDLAASGDKATLIARLDPKTTAATGRRIRLLLDPESLYFFDPETEEALYS